MTVRRPVIAVSITAVTLAVAGIWVWQASARPASAEEAAVSYLRALESGDPEAVSATGIAASSDSLAAFGDARAFVTDTAVDSVEQDGAEATASVSFTVDGTARDADIRLSMVDGRWTPDPASLASMSTSVSIGSAISIGDAVFSSSQRIALLPAVYTLTAAPADILDASAEVVALPGDSIDVALDVGLRPEATASAQRILDDHLEECARSLSIPQDGCGIRIPWGTEFRAVTDASFRIETLPTIVLDEDGTGFTAGGGELVVTLDGTGQDGADRTTTYRTGDWAVRGDVTFTQTEMALTVW